MQRGGGGQDKGIQLHKAQVLTQLLQACRDTHQGRKCQGQLCCTVFVQKEGQGKGSLEPTRSRYSLNSCSSNKRQCGDKAMW
jgi:hypothetical protein